MQTCVQTTQCNILPSHPPTLSLNLPPMPLFQAFSRCESVDSCGQWHNGEHLLLGLPLGVAARV